MISKVMPLRALKNTFNCISSSQDADSTIFTPANTVINSQNTSTPKPLDSNQGAEKKKAGFFVWIFNSLFARDKKSEDDPELLKYKKFVEKQICKLTVEKGKKNSNTDLFKFEFRLKTINKILHPAKTQKNSLQSYSFQEPMESICFNLQAGEEIRLATLNDEYVFCKTDDSNYKLFMVQGEGNIQILPNGENIFDIGIAKIQTNQKCIKYEGPEDLSICSNNIIELIKAQKGEVHKFDLKKGHVIGSLYDPSSGHIIEGGRYPRDPKIYKSPTETIIVDFNNDVVLKQKYNNIKEYLDFNRLPEAEIVYRVYWEFKDTASLTDEDALKIGKTQSGLRIGPLLERIGGVCRHKSVAIAAILEKLIKENYLQGKIFYASGVGHAWALYRATNNNIYIIDRAQNHFTDLAYEPDAYYEGANDQLCLYMDAIPDEVLG